MQLTPFAAVAIQLSVLVAAAAVLLRGAPGLRWLRVVLLGLGWMLFDAALQPLAASGLPVWVVDAEVGLLAAQPVVAAIADAGLLVAFLAAAAELRTARSVLVAAVTGTVVLAAASLLVPPGVAGTVGLAGWVVGTLCLAETVHRSARRRPGSLLEARLRVLAGGLWLLAAVALADIGGPFPVVWLLPMVVGTLLLVVAVAPPPFLRLTPARTRASVRGTDDRLATVGPGDAEALGAALDGVRAVLGGDAAVLVDDGAVVAETGQPAACDLGRAWIAACDARGAAPDARGTGLQSPAPIGGGRWAVAADTGRGPLVAVLPAVGVLLSQTDLEHFEALAERLGLVLTREHARRADERAAASMEAAERMRDDMLSTLSHELRTPLTTIMGFAEVLRRDPGALDQEQVRHMLGRIVDRGMHLELIVSALLDLTSVRGRSEPDRIAAYELRALLERARMRTADRLADHAVDVVGEVGVVQTDGGALLAVVEELLTNAAKFSPVDTPIEVVASASGGEVVVEVRDRGPGFADLGARAFEPFVRGGDVLTRTTDGVGIGLTVARELARQLDGRLEAAPPAPGAVGAVLRLTFPRRHPLAPHGDVRRPLAAEHAEGDPTLVPSGRRGSPRVPLVRGSG